MITVSLPFDYGTFVKIVNPKFDRRESVHIGTVSAYTITNDGIAAWVSGYKESSTGEYMIEEIVPLTKEEIDELINLRGE